MKIAPAAEIKAQFNAYLEAAADGPVIVIKNGKPVAVLLGVSDDDEIERLILAYSSRFRAMLDAAEQRICTIASLPHDRFWEQLDAEYAAVPAATAVAEAVS